MPDTPSSPRIIVVTDRRRLVRAMDADADDWPRLLHAQIAGALAGGADLVHVREPDLGAGRLTRFLRTVFDEVPGSASRVVVNDRVDVAWVTGAAGVHLTERSLSVAEVRRLQPAGCDWVVGQSVHEPSRAAATRGATYLVAGAVLPSAAKPAGWRLLGWAGLAEIVRAADNTPVLAIGGLGPGNVRAVLDAGAVGLAGIGCFFPEPGFEVASSVAHRVHAMRAAFDTVGGETYTQETGG